MLQVVCVLELWCSIENFVFTLWFVPFNVSLSVVAVRTPRIYYTFPFQIALDILFGLSASRQHLHEYVSIDFFCKDKSCPFGYIVFYQKSERFELVKHLFCEKLISHQSQSPFVEYMHPFDFRSKSIHASLATVRTFSNNPTNLLQVQRKCHMKKVCLMYQNKSTLHLVSSYRQTVIRRFPQRQFIDIGAVIPSH